MLFCYAKYLAGGTPPEPPRRPRAAGKDDPMPDRSGRALTLTRGGRPHSLVTRAGPGAVWAAEEWLAL